MKKTLISNISPAYNYTMLTESGENSKQILVMVMDESHQWISFKIMKM